MTDLEQQLTDHLRRRAAAATSRYDLEGIEKGSGLGSLVDLDDRRPRRRSRSALLVAVAAAAAAVIAIAVVTIPSDESRVSTPSDQSTVSTSARAPGGGLAFAAAIEASDVLTSPSAGEVAQAMDGDLYKETGPAEVSAAGNYVSLLSCRARASSTCGTGWAYVTRAADGSDVHGGRLGEASYVDLDLLDDRYFVASESSPNAHAPSKAWLIDAVSGKAGALSRRDQPTTLNSPEQALLLPWGSTPQVVDARDGTIRPLAVPDDVAVKHTVAQHDSGRIWVGTDRNGDGLGLAYSDDGGATWSEIALPEQLRTTSEEDYSIAADGDRVAVTSGLQEGGAVYVSDDAGRSWTTATHPKVGLGNRAELYVLADGRLVLMWYLDASAQQLLVSTGSEWTELEKVDGHSLAHTPLFKTDFGVNRAGIAVVPSYVEECATLCYRGEGGWVLDTIDFSSDLKHWSTIESRRLTLAKGDVKIGGSGGQTLKIIAEKQDGEVSGEFFVNNVLVALECADTDTIEGEIRLGGTVTDDPDGHGLAVIDGQVAVGDRVALIIRKWSADHESVAFYANDSAGSCTKLVDSVPYNLDGGYFSSVENGYDIETIGGYFNP